MRHKQAQTGEFKSRELAPRIQTLFENLNDAAAVMDAEAGLVLEANKQATILFGKSRNEILGMSKLEIHPPDKAGEYKHSIAKIVKKHTLLPMMPKLLTSMGKSFRRQPVTTL